MQESDPSLPAASGDLKQALNMGWGWSGPKTLTQELCIQASEIVQSFDLGHPVPSFNPGSVSSSHVTLGKSLFLLMPLFTSVN